MIWGGADETVRCNSFYVYEKQWRIQKFWKGGAEDNLSAPSSFIANAHNEIYAFYMEKSGFLEKKYEPIGGRPHRPLKSATGEKTKHV